MIHTQVPKLVSITPAAAAIASGAVTCASLDTQGFDLVKITVFFGAMDIATTVFKVSESDTDSAYATITGADFTVAPLTLPVGTDDNHFFSFYVNMKAHKRWLKLAVTFDSGSANYIVAWAELSRSGVTPTTAAGRGNTQECFV
jgi:hypothetical protein